MCPECRSAQPLPALQRRERWRQSVKAVAAVLLVGATVGIFLPRAGSQPAPIASYQACATAGYPIAQTDPPVCRVGSERFVGPAAPAASAAVLGESSQSAPRIGVTYDVLVEGDSGGTYPAGPVAIQTPAQWQHYWATVHAALPALPPILPVDFTSSSVIAFNAGRQPTSGYGFRVTGIMTGASGSTVRAIESRPSAGCPTAAKPTNSYRIVRSDRLTEPVKFEISVEERRCAS